MPEEPYNPSPIGNPSVLARRNWWQTMLVKLIGKYTPKCREMVRILSQSMDESMPLMMRIKKRLHFLICCWCQRYEDWKSAVPGPPPWTARSGSWTASSR